MCYSAQVWQSYQDYVRRFGAEISIREFVELYPSCEKGAKIKTAKAMDDAFLRAKSLETNEIARSIEAWNTQQATELEQLLFRQRRRLVGAERTLQSKSTKKALDDQRIATNKIDWAKGNLVMRSRALKILDEEGAQALFKRRSARWGAKSEPGDGDRVPERPRLLRRTIDLLVEENVMPIESIPRHIGLAPHDIAMLAGLPEGYFQGKPKIVQLARLRSVPCTSDQSMPTEVGTVVPFRPMPKR